MASPKKKAAKKAAGKKGASKRAPKRAGGVKKKAPKKMAKLGTGKKLWDRAAIELDKDGYHDMEVKAKLAVWKEFEVAMNKVLGEKVKVSAKPEPPEEEWAQDAGPGA